jgi:hypothetical protein
VTLQHVVLFSFDPELSAADERSLLEQVRAWPETIGGIDAIRIGRSIDDARTRGYQYLLYMELADLDALRRYQQHEVHQKFQGWVLDLHCTPLAFDYYLNAETVVHPARS